MRLLDTATTPHTITSLYSSPETVYNHSKCLELYLDHYEPSRTVCIRAVQSVHLHKIYRPNVVVTYVVRSVGYGYGWGRGRGERGYGGGRGWRAGIWVQKLPEIPPPSPGIVRVVASIEVDRGLDSPIAMRFGRAPYLAVVDISAGHVMNLNIVPNVYVSEERGVGVGIAQWIVMIGASIVLGPHIGPNAMMILQQAGIRFIPIQPGTPLRIALRIAGLLP